MYQVVVRFSNASGTGQPDTKPDLRGMALRVQVSPNRTASVSLPECASVGISRRLLATNTADDSAPVVTASTTPTQSTRNAWVY